MSMKGYQCNGVSDRSIPSELSFLISGLHVDFDFRSVEGVSLCRHISGILREVRFGIEPPLAVSISSVTSSFGNPWYLVSSCVYQY